MMVYCQIKDVNIHYEVFGEGKPIILLHGFSVDFRLMLECMEPALKEVKGYRRIYLDLPGMGLSNHSDWINNSDRMLDIVEAFIRKVIPDERFLIAGQSYGGYLARGILYKMKEMADGLLLICPVIIADSASRNVPQPVVIQKEDKLLSGLPPEEAEELAGMVVVQSMSVLDRCRNEVLSGIKKADLEFLGKIKEKYSFSFDVDDGDKAYFGKPTLFLLGRQDSCVGYQDAWSILKNYPRATFAVLDVAGHNLQIEQPELLNSLVKEWIARTEKCR